jgi:ABC-2 type transport system permease protein
MIRLHMVRLVAEREIRERARSKVFRISTVVLLVASLALVLIPTLIGDDGPDRQTIALSGGPAGLGDALIAAAAAQGRELTVRRQDDAAAAERAGASGDVDAGVVVSGDGASVRVVVEKELSDGLRASIAQGLGAARVREALAVAGVSAARIDELGRPPEVTVRAVNPDDFQGGDLAVGYVVAVILYMTLLFAGAVVAGGVAEEKTSRVSEVLLASLRPSELLIGKLVGIGLTTLVQLAVAALPALVAAMTLDLAELPDTTGAVVAWGLVWFVVGYALYSAAYGALGALVGRQQEVGQVTAFPAGLLLLGYLATTVIPGDPEAVWVQVGSILPPFAPMMMPMRVATGGVPAPEMALALVLTVAAAVGAIAYGARVYRGGITRTGPRLSLREALRPRVSGR